MKQLMSNWCIRGANCTFNSKLSSAIDVLPAHWQLVHAGCIAVGRDNSSITNVEQLILIFSPLLLNLN